METMKQTIVFLTIIIALVGVILLQHHKLSDRTTEYVNDTITLTVTDTITLEKPTLWVKEVVRTDTLTLHSTDTITDSVMVELPISTYVLDTIIATDSSKTHLKGILEGFSVEVDSISITYEKTHQEVCLTPKTRSWHWGFGVALGFGFVK
jgi:hypothetical protein